MRALAIAVLALAAFGAQAQTTPASVGDDTCAQLAEDAATSIYREYSRGAFDLAVQGVRDGQSMTDALADARAAMDANGYPQRGFPYWFSRAALAANDQLGCTLPATLVK